MNTEPTIERPGGLSSVEDGVGGRGPALPGAPLSAWYALAVLVLVTLFAFVDRQIFILMAEPIRLHLGLSDLQLGLLQGLGIALFAAIMGYPLGWLADRFDRRAVLAACIVVWSLAVVACGVSRSFGQLLLASAVIGAGEAGLLPVVFGLIPELFAGERRALANSVYSVASRLGASAGIALCGLLIHWVERARPLLPASIGEMETWRLSFFAAALPAPLMVLLLTTIAVPGTARKIAAARVEASPSRLLGHLRRHLRTFLPFFAGIAMVGFGFGAVMNWVTVVVMRMYGATPEQAGNGIGAAMTAGTVVGFVASVYGIRHFTRRFGTRLPIRVMWTASLSGAATTLMLLLARDARDVYVLQGVQLAFIMAAIMIYPTALQDLSPVHLRSQIVALGAVISIAVGATSPVLVGALSDQLKGLPNGLLLASVSVGTVGLLFGGALLWWSESSWEATVRAAGSGVASEAGGAGACP